MMGLQNQIIFVEHVRPIFCRKIWYWQRAIFLARANRRLPEIAPIEIRMPPPPESHPNKNQDSADKPRAARDITPQDIPKLSKLKLTDYAVNFSNIQLPKGEKLTGEDLQTVFDSFIQQVTT